MDIERSNEGDVSSFSSSDGDNEKEQRRRRRRRHALCAVFLLSRSRGAAVRRTRVLWDNHVRLGLEDGSFSRKYRMSYVAFKLLCETLRPVLSLNERMARGGPVTVSCILLSFLS